MKGAITEQFHEHLYGNHFVIYTDNNPLTYVLTSAKLDANGHWWVAGLANYNFALKCHSGKVNVDVDALSCIPKGEYNQHIETDSVHALISQAVQDTTLMEAYSCNVHVTESLDMQKDLKAMSVKDRIIAQNKGSVIREIKYLIHNKRLMRRKVKSQDAQITKQYLRQCHHLVLFGGPIQMDDPIKEGSICITVGDPLRLL